MMADYNARILILEPAVLAAEQAALGARGVGGWGLGVGTESPTPNPQPPAPLGVLALRLEGLPEAAALAVQQVARAVGGEAWITTVGAAATGGALLLLARERAETLPLRLGAAGWLDVAAQIEDLLARLDAPPGALVCGPYTLPVGTRTLVMGIVNMTPDSFSGDSLHGDVAAALAQARQMHADGADLVDIGGLSTRPGSDPVSVEEELRRVVPAVQAIAAAVPLPLSVDTYRAAVADAALAAGAHIVNDITGFRDDPAILDVAARHGAAVIAMHIQGHPATMQQQPTYHDLLGEVIATLRESVYLAQAAGISRDRIWIDPGIGFGKTAAHNLELLHRLGELRSLGQPILVGTSRKAFIGRLLGGKPPAERVTGTGATVAVSIAHGADVVRVHDVGPAVEVARVADAIVRFPFGARSPVPAP